jgi:hypothetical protein
VFLYTDEHGMADLEAAVVNLPADLSDRIRHWLEVNDAGLVCGTPLRFRMKASSGLAITFSATGGASAFTSLT